VLSITDTKEISARTWDEDKQAWARDTDGNLVPSKATALKYVAVKPEMTPAQIKAANDMLVAEYVSNYSDYVVTE
jgi:hypothetical protein